MIKTIRRLNAEGNEMDIDGGVNMSGPVLAKAYDDLVHPVAEPVGEMLGYLPRTIRIGLSKWSQWIVNSEESLRRTGEALRDKASRIPEQRQCDPEPNVAVPAIMQVSYCYDSDELREMYANLLATAMDSLEKSHVHPGFVGIIQQLTPDEAKLLASLPHDQTSLSPVVDLRRTVQGKTGFITLFRNYSRLCEGICEYPQQGPTYLENLARLKLVEIPDDLHLTDDSPYEALINSEAVLEVQKSLPPNTHLDIHKKVVYLTNFGIEFIRCCIEDYSPEKYN